MAEIDTKRYGEASQILYMIDTLGKLEAAGTIRPAEKAELDRLRQMTAPAQDTVNRTRAGYRGMGQGVTFNAGDEIGAYLRSLGGADYDTALETARARNSVSELNYPDEYNKGKTAGAGMTMVLPTGAVGAGINTAKAGAIGITALGALEGAAAASAPDFFEGEGGFTNRVANIDPKTAAIGAVLGGGAGYLSGKGQAQDLADYKDWIAKNTPAERDTVALAKGMQFYKPNYGERYDMLDPNRTPTQAEDAFLYFESLANKMRAAGASRAEILSKTGMMDMPAKGAGGEDVGATSWAVVDKSILEDLRPSRAGNYGYDIRYEPLPANLGGDVSADTKTIRINSNNAPNEQETTLVHELNHADQVEAGQAAPLVGANTDYMRYERKRIMGELRDRIASAPDKATAKQLKEQLAKLSKMTSYELYSNNPGEMLARLASGETSSAVRLTPKELLNPNINKKSAPNRIADAMTTSLTSELRPYMEDVNLAKELFGGPFGMGAPVKGDFHRRVPMDLDKSIVTDKQYLQWIRAGKPTGNYQRWLNSLP